MGKGWGLEAEEAPKITAQFLSPFSPSSQQSNALVGTKGLLSRVRPPPIMLRKLMRSRSKALAGPSMAEKGGCS